MAFSQIGTSPVQSPPRGKLFNAIMSLKSQQCYNKTIGGGGEIFLKNITGERAITDVRECEGHFRPHAMCVCVYGFPEGTAKDLLKSCHLVRAAQSSA